MPAERQHLLRNQHIIKPGRNGGRAVMPAERGWLRWQPPSWEVPQWRAGCYARRTRDHESPAGRMTKAAMEGGLLCPPNETSPPPKLTPPTVPQWRAGCYARRTCPRRQPSLLPHAAMEGGLLCPPNETRERPELGERRGRNGGRAVMPAERTCRLFERSVYSIGRNGGRAVMPAEPA